MERLEANDLVIKSIVEALNKLGQTEYAKSTKEFYEGYRGQIIANTKKEKIGGCNEKNI